jgi:hypothetical protein
MRIRGGLLLKGCVIENQSSPELADCEWASVLGGQAIALIVHSHKRAEGPAAKQFHSGRYFVQPMTTRFFVTEFRTSAPRRRADRRKKQGYLARGMGKTVSILAKTYPLS